MDFPEYVLIIASSGRMLAQAAKHAGMKPLVIDLFADQDTQDYAEAFRQIPSLAEQHLAEPINHFMTRYGVAHVIYGSGFEQHTESLHDLSSRLIVLGNAPDDFAKQHDKSAFFSILEHLDIPHPDVCFSAPDNAGDWLVKPMQGQGGVGIKRYHPKDPIDAAVYWQKFQAGTQHSALFLADGKKMRIIGLNTQWSVNLNENQEFMFSGIMNCCALLNSQTKLITDWLEKLVPVFALKGLNSMDFILSGKQCWVLEINPRPSASMQLYAGDLISRHIKASLGELTENSPYAGCTGFQIIYAGYDVSIPEGFEWPHWCMDLPESGFICRIGQPICSIIAHQNSAQSVMNELLIKQHTLQKVFKPHGI
jgi:uncharacterized protein